MRKETQNKLQVTFLDGHNLDWITETDFKVKDTAQRFELYERNRALTLGLGKAVEYALSIGVDRIWQRIQLVAGILRQKLRGIAAVSVYDFGRELCGIVTFSIDGIESQSVKKLLAEKNINVSVGIAKSTLIYMNKNKLTSVLRASVHYYNTEDEISIMCELLESTIKSATEVQTF